MDPLKVFSGREVWYLHATHGLPLEVTIPALSEKGLMISWLDLLMAAHQDGAAWDVLIPRICAAVQDSSWSRDFVTEICRRLRTINEVISS